MSGLSTLGDLDCWREKLFSLSLRFSLSLPLFVNGICDLSVEGDQLIARRKAVLSSADFWKGFAFVGEGCVRGVEDCVWDCDIFCVGEKISWERGLFLLNLSLRCSERRASNLSLLSSRCCFGDWSLAMTGLTRTSWTICLMKSSCFFLFFGIVTEAWKTVWMFSPGNLLCCLSYLLASWTSLSKS